MNSGIWIPVVAILGGFAIPIVAIIMDFRRRRLQYEERRAMIEHGMTPPPLQESEGGQHGTPEERRERVLMGGVLALAVGVGLGFAAYLLGNGLVASFIPNRVAGPLTLAASVTGFVGIGMLVYYAISRPRGGS